MRRLLLTFGFTVLTAVATHAGVFKFPEETPLVSIDVPDSWHPNTSEDSIDTASPDRKVFFWLAVHEASDAGAVKADALKALTRNGMTIDQAGAKEKEVSFAGLGSTETQFAARDNGKPRVVRIRSTRVGDNRYLQLVQWGPAAAFDKHATALNKIFASVKVIGK